MDAQLKSLNNKMEISRCVSLSRIDAKHNPVTAFIRLHEALHFILSSDNPQEDLVWYKDELNERMAHIAKTCFKFETPNKIQELKNCYMADKEKVKVNENYFLVHAWYDILMDMFENNLDDIANKILNESVEPYNSEII